ncbi:MAG TPA: condensation domain-containing protein, partial [Longimicrobium sp.]|nr:condensation domain-containing protein [Longimicrobium sp.]
MTAPATAGLSREEKQALLRTRLAERIAKPRRVPCSFAQERLWLMDRMHGAGAAYNLHTMILVPGRIDVPAVERAVGELVRRHEALRTVFAEQDGAPVQVILPFTGFTLPIVEMPGADEAALRRFAADETAVPFDLATGPLMRGMLLRLAPDDHVLLLVMHHIVSDGWSMGVISVEVAELYEAFRNGRPSPLPEPGFQYADYAVQQRERMRGDVLAKQLAYWRERLADAPALLELPLDRPRPPVQTYRGAVRPISLPRVALERLEELARTEGVTLHMVLSACFQVLLSKYAGTEDVVLGSPVAGRSRRELEKLIGFFVNTVVLRTDLSGDPGFREVLRR